MTNSRKIIAGSAVALMIGATMAATPAAAWGRYHNNNGAAVAGALVGGMALGAAVGAMASQPHYNNGYGQPYGYGGYEEGYGYDEGYGY